MTSVMTLLRDDLHLIASFTSIAENLPGGPMRDVTAVNLACILYRIAATYGRTAA